MFSSVSVLYCLLCVVNLCARYHIETCFTCSLIICVYVSLLCEVRQVAVYLMLCTVSVFMNIVL